MVALYLERQYFQSTWVIFRLCLFISIIIKWLSSLFTKKQKKN